VPAPIPVAAILQAVPPSASLPGTVTDVSDVRATALFGMPVEIDGTVGRLTDLGIVRARESWLITAVRSHRRTGRLVRWSPAGAVATADGAGGEATWLRECLFDRQIVDLAGRRVIRVGDVVLRPAGDLLSVVAVEVGAAAVIRRLGLVALAAHIRSQLVPIEHLHIPGERGEALLLDTSRARLEQLESGTVAALLARLPVATAEHAVRRSRHRDAVARHARILRRRRRNPRAPR
jgi:hypothetical protein